MSPSLGCQAIELPTGHRVRRPHGTTDSHSPGPCGRRRVPEARRQHDRCLGPWCFETKPTPSSSLEASLLSSMPAAKDGSKSWAKDIFDPRAKGLDHPRDSPRTLFIHALLLPISGDHPDCNRCATSPARPAHPLLSVQGFLLCLSRLARILAPDTASSVSLYL